MLMDMCLPKFIIQVQYLQIVLIATQTFDVLILFLKKFCLSCLKFMLSDVASFLPQNLCGLQKN